MSGHDTNYLRSLALKAGIDENKIHLLCKSNIVNLYELLENHKKTITTYCKRCNKNYNVSEDRIFSGGDFSTYATRCPVCGFGRGLPFKEVEEIFGKLKV